MAAIPYGVAEAFARGDTARSGAFVSMGDALYSYALRLAHRDEHGAIVIDIDPEVARKRSVTTARHVAAMVGAGLTTREGVDRDTLGDHHQGFVGDDWRDGFELEAMSAALDAHDDITRTEQEYPA